MLKKNLLIFNLFFISFLIFSGLGIVKGEEYLNTVIEKINKMEKDLQKLREESSMSNGQNTTYPNNNTIASHEQRLVDLEEELRSINGRIDQVFFDLKNLSIELSKFIGSNKTVKQNSENSNNIENNYDSENLVTIQKEKKEIVVSEDPNKERNPSMKVLGTIKEDQLSQSNNVNKKLTNSNDAEIIDNFSQDEEIITNQQLTELSKSPSDIYKHAYGMLVQENFSEAEKYFNIFLGENPSDPLASNAYYWLGETFYVQKQFEKAAISFAKGYKKFPKGNKALDQLFKLALTFINLGKYEDACSSFSKLELEFPNASQRIKTRAKEYKSRAKC